jgi:ABC-type Fe3+/spermidine/putrescine transport system ATPase subunit
MPSITLKGVRKSYGDIRAADGLDLEVLDGEYLCILGPTGSGKTTMLRTICGLTLPESGAVMLDGTDITRWEPEDRGAVMLSQTYSLFPQMTVAENVLFGPVLKGMPDEEQKHLLADMLDIVRLSSRADALPRELSGGMMQRTALARALASGTEILLLDEPLRALDARLRISLRLELRSLAKDLGLTTIHVTHDQEEALVMADRIAVLRQGRIVQVGTPGEVFDYPVSPFVANFVGQSNFFTGRIESKAGKTIIRLLDGRTVPARACQYPVGEDVVVGVKVGNTDISKEEQGPLQGRIERILFEGKFLFIDIQVQGVGLVSSKVPSWRMGKLNVGDDVNVRWAWEKATVFQMPTRGLAEELRVD